MCTHRHLGAEVIDKLVCGGAVGEFEVKSFGHGAHVNYILGRVVVDHLVVVVMVAVPNVSPGSLLIANTSPAAVVLGS